MIKENTPKYDHTIDYAKLMGKTIKVPANFKPTGNHAYGCLNGLYWQAYMNSLHWEPHMSECPFIFFMDNVVDESGIGRYSATLQKANLEFI